MIRLGRSRVETYEVLSLKITVQTRKEILHVPHHLSPVFLSLRFWRLRDEKSQLDCSARYTGERMIRNLRHAWSAVNTACDFPRARETPRPYIVHSAMCRLLAKNLSHPAAEVSGQTTGSSVGLDRPATGGVQEHCLIPAVSSFTFHPAIPFP